MSDTLHARILSATIASCDCLTKTPDPEHHRPTCRYRCLRESADAVQALTALVAKIDELTPGMNGIFQIAAIHGAAWPAEKNWVEELAAARKALSHEP